VAQSALMPGLEVVMAVTLERVRPRTVERVDAALKVLSASLLSLDGAERGAVLLEVDRLLDVRLRLRVVVVEAEG
jgi:hypothetical protein